MSEYVMVPREPTPEMMEVGMKKIIHGGAHNGLKQAYRAMLALSAPAPSQGAGTGREGVAALLREFDFYDAYSDGHHEEYAAKLIALLEPRS